MVTRRGVLAGLWLAGIAAPGAARQGRGFADDPFRLGVASGSPTASSVVLWTRLAPEPLAVGGGMELVPMPVQWAVATDPNFRQLVASGTALASPVHAHSVHVDVGGLRPATRYWYRFVAGGVRSPVGTTRTLPDAHSDAESTTFATVCCQNYTHGHFSAYRKLVELRPDFVLHLGDYIYDAAFGGTVRAHESSEPLRSLDDFRRRHALYKLDASLAAAHASIPFFLTLDNHDAVEDGDGTRENIRWAAYRAWCEHMPVRSFLSGHTANISRQIDIGRLMRIELLDTRQFRDRQDICPESAKPSLGFGLYRAPCAEMLRAERTMLGTGAERNLLSRLRPSAPAASRPWTVIASSVPIAPMMIRAKDQLERSYIASWSGYPAARRRLLGALPRTPQSSAMVLSGDIHSSWGIELRDDAAREETTFATEIVTPSLTSSCPPQLAAPLANSLPFNPHVRFHNLRDHGFALHKVSRAEWRCELWFSNDLRAANHEAKLANVLRVRPGKKGFVS